MYDINVLIHSVNNLIRNKYWYTFFLFWLFLMSGISQYLSVFKCCIYEIRHHHHPPTPVRSWQNLNFLKSEIYFFTFSPHFTFIVKFLVNYRIFPDYLQKGFLKISFEKSFISLHLELRTPQTDISRLGSSPQCFRF